jgi:uncharacterized repeat protein (TIGR01451 family)
MAALAAGTAMIALQTAPAVAEGTNAGTVITNTVTVDYRVGGVDQTERTAQSQFTVDRRVNVRVNRMSDPTTVVVPGRPEAVIAFDVSNLSNDTIDLVLAATQASSGDDFDATGVTIYRDDGVFSARGSYTVSAASLTVTKTSRVIADLVNGTTNPKAIPGATVEYCIAVTNAAGSATATDVVVTDVVPADLTIVTGSVRVNGGLDGSNNCTGGDPGGSVSGQTISAPLDDIAASATRTASFRATIN